MTLLFLQVLFPTVHNSQGLLTTIINDLENIQARDRCTQQGIDDITNKINDVFSKTFVFRCLK
jgi:hypothetical protein